MKQMKYFTLMLILFALSCQKHKDLLIGESRKTIATTYTNAKIGGGQ